MIWVSPLLYHSGLLLILFPLLGIAKKEIMQMRRPSRRRLMPAHLQFHVMSGFRRDFPPVRSLSLSLSLSFSLSPSLSLAHAKGISEAGGRLWTARTRHAYRNYVGGAKRIFITREFPVNSTPPFLYFRASSSSSYNCISNL